jgi:hypothetical protein
MKSIKGHRLMIADVEHPVGRIAGRRIGVGGSVPGIGRRHPVVHPQHGFDDVVHVGEVALHAAVVEDVDRPTFEDRPGEQEGRHVGSAPRAIDREEAQAGGRQAIEVAVGVRHQLVGLLGRGVEADRVIDVVTLGEGHARVAAVDAGTRGVDQMLNRVMAAAFEDVHEADQIAVDVGVGVEQRVAHAGLGGQMDHSLETFAANNAAIAARSAMSIAMKRKFPSPARQARRRA